MCASGAQCGCSGGSSGLKVIAAAAVTGVALAGASAAAATIADALTVVLVALGVLAVAGAAGFAHLIRREGRTGLYAPEKRPALPGTRSHALPARSAAAISTGRRPILVTAITIHEGEHS